MLNCIVSGYYKTFVPDKISNSSIQKSNKSNQNTNLMKNYKISI